MVATKINNFTSTLLNFITNGFVSLLSSKARNIIVWKMEHRTLGHCMRRLVEKVKPKKLVMGNTLLLLKINWIPMLKPWRHGSESSTNVTHHSLAQQTNALRQSVGVTKKTHADAVYNLFRGNILDKRRRAPMNGAANK